MKIQRLSISELPRYIPNPLAIHKPSARTCQEHTTPLIEIWQGNIKVSEYCPACCREQMKEVSEH